ncbi:hypothetical protein PENANT_c014G01870 [Penicillium antarcticum]|uniref:Zn(2)-C6 fungal-type domain-containing protein n=1 Tax=Penicillium antarcticum TaxID=416450 RepID=A0A1V6Q4B0_9EURO|nr:uncharacterized protein N7508_009511 [Penicillium antarcticum]KAJ5294690.1 hypothetical protein N7508_009511 [Penicillium antarcticum]OQD84103.1 hypothetical protein PENANT_c014G01870 [Penicillium antarcticum]
MSGITRGHSCTLCQRRKVRCDKQKPCGNCVKANAECIAAPMRPRGKRNTPKPQGKDLAERVKKYEELMTRHGLDFESLIGQGTSGAPELPQNKEVSPKEGPGNKRPSRTTKEIDSKWFAYYNEYRATDEMLNGSSDEENERPTVHHAFDAMFSDNSGFPFFAGSSQTETLSHPSSTQVIQLWQIYINNVNPVLKISHVPTLQPQIIEACTNLVNIPKPISALMFGIYLTAIISMDEKGVQNILECDQSTAFARYREAMEQALIDACFMKSSDFMVLQAYILYLITMRLWIDPRSLFCLIGIAVRMATRIGLHRDGAQFGLSPFDTEQRRRLWWQIVVLDKRIAEITGSPINALSSMGADCRYPLNVNDTDLHPQSKEPPLWSPGITEMTFALTRIEITIASAPNGIRPNPRAPESAIFNKASTTDPTSQTPDPNISETLDRYCRHMETTYLKHCNTEIPLQLFTLLMTRVSLHKLRVLDFVCRGTTSPDPDKERQDAAFLAAIEMLESDNTIHSTPSLRGLVWYSHMHIPLPGYIFLANELRDRTHGELCERAWIAICRSPYHKGLSRNLRSPLHVALAQALLKSWRAKERVELKSGRVLQVPGLVSSLRESLPGHLTKQKVGRNVAGAAMEAEDWSKPSSMHETGNMMSGENMLLESMTLTDDFPGSSSFDYNQVFWTNLMQAGAFGGIWNGYDYIMPQERPTP